MMTDDKPAEKPEAEETLTPEEAARKKKEFGGRDGPDPTRFGDWEKNGRCVDF